MFLREQVIQSEIFKLLGVELILQRKRYPCLYRAQRERDQQPLGYPHSSFSAESCHRNTIFLLSSIIRNPSSHYGSRTVSWAVQTGYQPFRALKRPRAAREAASMRTSYSERYPFAVDCDESSLYSLLSRPLDILWTFLTVANREAMIGCGSSRHSISA